MSTSTLSYRQHRYPAAIIAGCVNFQRTTGAGGPQTDMLGRVRAV
jgi:hypothetical protein